jgi:hypothetical protein
VGRACGPHVPHRCHPILLRLFVFRSWKWAGQVRGRVAYIGSAVYCDLLLIRNGASGRQAAGRPRNVAIDSVGRIGRSDLGCFFFLANKRPESAAAGQACWPIEMPPRSIMAAATLLDGRVFRRFSIIMIRQMVVAVCTLTVACSIIALSSSRECTPNLGQLLHRARIERAPPPPVIVRTGSGPVAILTSGASLIGAKLARTATDKPAALC